MQWKYYDQNESTGCYVKCLYGFLQELSALRSLSQFNTEPSVSVHICGWVIIMLGWTQHFQPDKHKHIYLLHRGVLSTLHVFSCLFSFFIVGFPVNCLSLYVAWMLMRNGNNTAVYLVNLSISDLLFTICWPCRGLLVVSAV